MMKRLRNLWNQPLYKKGLLIQAYVLLGLSRLAILTVPFRKLAGYFGRPQEETSNDIPDEQVDVTLAVSWAVQQASRYTPWTSNCFSQALVAQYLLSRRGIASTLYFGATNDGPESMRAHAWLRSGKKILTGRLGHEEFPVLATFARHQ